MPRQFNIVVEQIFGVLVPMYLRSDWWNTSEHWYSDSFEHDTNKILLQSELQYEPEMSRATLLCCSVVNEQGVCHTSRLLVCRIWITERWESLYNSQMYANFALDWSQCGVPSSQPHRAPREDLVTWTSAREGPDRGNPGWFEWNTRLSILATIHAPNEPIGKGWLISCGEVWLVAGLPRILLCFPSMGGPMFMADYSKVNQLRFASSITETLLSFVGWQKRSRSNVKSRNVTP